MTVFAPRLFSEVSSNFHVYESVRAVSLYLHESGARASKRRLRVGAVWCWRWSRVGRGRVFVCVYFSERAYERIEVRYLCVVSEGYGVGKGA